ncbi:hypothetical protein [Hahella sp. NBU794]|uniref:hypothetical protein n=1 Tax=Hahella sp. NBU794 TaxID=3422590 RepID=UPI003D6F77BD
MTASLSKTALQYAPKAPPQKKHIDLSRIKMPQQHPWHKWARHPKVMPYNRLAVLMTAFNIGALYWLTNGGWRIDQLPMETVLNGALVNFTIAILIRQQYVVNALFAIATSMPTHWPLKWRWAMGKVYHFGGIHVGGFFCGTLWYAAFTVFSLLGSYAALPLSIPILASVHLSILTLMIILALPDLRAKYHDQFEFSARFGSWASVLLFWAQTLILSAAAHPVSELPSALATSPQVWALAAVTLSILAPWLRLRKVEVTIHKPSNHAVIADFNYGVTPFAGSSTDLSLNPLFEWHAFANIPLPGREGFQLAISRAGDWTGAFIDNQPRKVWVKGIPTAGVGNIETLFKKVVWIATGSGIGPCLPHLVAQGVPAKLVWATRNPRKTYGDELVNDIKAAHPDALIWDTDTHGKPDLARLAYLAYRDTGAEAVICISNKKVTWNVVYELESRGIPAFGAIWDS